MKKRKYQSGVTLAEVLVAVAISALIAEAAYFTSTAGQRAYKATGERIEVTQNARIALDRMSRELRQATEIVTNLPPTPDDPSNPPKTEIMFRDGHISPTIRYIIYKIEGTDLKKTVRAYYFGTSSILPPESEWVPWNAKNADEELPSHRDIEIDDIANYISGVFFWGDNTITIDLTGTKAESTYHFTTSVLPRNV